MKFLFLFFLFTTNILFSNCLEREFSPLLDSAMSQASIEDEARHTAAHPDATAAPELFHHCHPGHCVFIWENATPTYPQPITEFLEFPYYLTLNGYVSSIFRPPIA